MDTHGKKRAGWKEEGEKIEKGGREDKKKKTINDRATLSFYSESSIISGNFRDLLISKWNCYLLDSRHGVR